MFGSFRDQVSGVLQAMLLVLGLSLGSSLLLIAFVFSIAVNERRRQIGVLRALGATRGAVIVSLLTEAAILAVAGAVVGVILASVCIYLFRDLLATRLGFFTFPSGGLVAGVVVAGLLLAVVCVAIAAAVPASASAGRSRPYPCASEGDSGVRGAASSRWMASTRSTNCAAARPSRRCKTSIWRSARASSWLSSDARGREERPC